MNNRSYLTFIIHGFTADADADWVYNMTRVLLHQSEPEQVSCGFQHEVAYKFTNDSEFPTGIAGWVLLRGSKTPKNVAFSNSVVALSGAIISVALQLATASTIDEL